MTDEKLGGGGDSLSSSSSKVTCPTSAFEKNGDRMRFTVELRPGETTIVSWKKLMKDAAKANEGPDAAAAPPPVAEPPANAHPNLESRLAPGQPAAAELNDAPANRMSAVIEKIERLYTGKDSSDEENLGDIPDDDQYDTEDSFIDDAELDEYFEVDKSKTKHDGFFVNRGKLESIETTQSPIQQPRKRRRKDATKALGESDHAVGPNKQMKVSRKGTGNSTLPVDKNPLLDLSERSMFSVKDSHADGSSNKSAGNKLIDGNESTPDRITIAQYKAQHVRPNNVSGSEVSALQKSKNGGQARLDLNLPSGKNSVHSVRSTSHKRDGSGVRPKGNMLEKAIRELEKMVSESRPPSGEAQDTDAAAQNIKRRLPPEVKQKLAKVARLAQSNHGKVSKELLNRLMGIVGHLVQLRTLKRNLKIMINTSLMAKQEKDDKFQRMKKETFEMIKIRSASLASKAAEAQLAGLDDFQESAHDNKGYMKSQKCMDAVLEDKLCDLYDTFVDSLDGDATPHVRKLYLELAELWPKEVVDHHGIKRAIVRAKERRRALHDKNKEQEKIKRKKLAAARMEGAVQVEGSSAIQPQHVRERVVSDSGNHATNSQARVSSGGVVTVGTTSSSAISALHLPNSSSNAPVLDKPKQSKLKGMSNHSQSDSRSGDDLGVKKKVKRKPELDMGQSHLHPDKFSIHGDEGQKLFKHAASPQRPSFQSAAPPSFEQST